MNKIIMSLFAAVGMFVAGCTDTPSESTVQATSYACGMVAGCAAKLADPSGKIETEVTAVLDKVAVVVPTTNETFIAKWTPIIEEEVAILVTSGKLNETQAGLVKTAATTATSGIDYLFTRHPDWKNYQNLINVASSGFIAGFKTGISAKISATNTITGEVIKADVEAFEAKFSSK